MKALNIDIFFRHIFAPRKYKKNLSILFSNRFDEYCVYLYPLNRNEINLYIFFLIDVAHTETYSEKRITTSHIWLFIYTLWIQAFI